MATKQKMVVLTYPHENPKTANGVDPLYQVVSVNNSTEYAPGQYLSKREVDELCSASRWTVSTKRPVSQ